jgi:hypothetical protein
MAPSAALESTIRTCADELGALHDRVSGCEVAHDDAHATAREAFDTARRILLGRVTGR